MGCWPLDISLLGPLWFDKFQQRKDTVGISNDPASFPELPWGLWLVLVTTGGRWLSATGQARGRGGMCIYWDILNTNHHSSAMSLTTDFQRWQPTGQVPAAAIHGSTCHLSGKKQV